MIPSSLSQAKSDPRLRGAPLAVYVWCLEYLDSREERPVKILLLCSSLRMKPNTAVFALKRLSEDAWIAKGARPKGEARHYRLLPAPMRQQVKARAA